MENKQLNKEVKFGLKSFLTTCAILLAVMITVGILTFVIPAGAYQVGDDGNILPDSFTLLQEQTRLPNFFQNGKQLKTMKLEQKFATAKNFINVIIKFLQTQLGHQM